MARQNTAIFFFAFIYIYIYHGYSLLFLPTGYTTDRLPKREKKRRECDEITILRSTLNSLSISSVNFGRHHCLAVTIILYGCLFFLMDLFSVISVISVILSNDTIYELK